MVSCLCVCVCVCVCVSVWYHIIANSEPWNSSATERCKPLISLVLQPKLLAFMERSGKPLKEKFWTRVFIVVAIIPISYDNIYSTIALLRSGGSGNHRQPTALWHPGEQTAGVVRRATGFSQIKLGSASCIGLFIIVSLGRNKNITRSESGLILRMFNNDLI